MGGDEGKMTHLMALDLMLPHVTAATVTDALSAFPIQLKCNVTNAWLTVAVRRSLAMTIRGKSDNPYRTSNSQIKAELNRLSKKSEGLWLEMFQMSQAANNKLRQLSFQKWPNQSAFSILDDPQFDLNRLKKCVAELDWAARYLRESAQVIEVQSPNWKRGEEYEIRVDRGYFLAPVYEAAYGQSIRVNNWPSDYRHRAPTHFMQFYQKMVDLAFGDKAVANLSQVLKEARKKHRHSPVEFHDGIIPSLDL
jgi:hypothetical protein